MRLIALATALVFAVCALPAQAESQEPTVIDIDVQNTLSDVAVEPLPRSERNSVPQPAPQPSSEPGDDVLQRGDVITLILPGEDDLNQNITIDSNGRIELPQAGALQIAELSIEDALERTRIALSRYYRDLDEMRLVLVERRLIVTVLGYVNTPGRIELAGDADMQIALTEAGGLRPGAQLDGIQIRRNGESIKVDFRAYLQAGDPGLLPRLRTLDEIFVPSSPLLGPVEAEYSADLLARAGDGARDNSSIRVFGEVNSPGEFSWKEGLGPIDLLMRAGGVTRFASVEQLRIMSGEGAPEVFNLTNYLETGDRSLLPKLTPGTTIYVPIKQEEIRTGASVVYVMGEVASPGAYESTEGATFMDILANAGGPTRFAETRQIRIIRPDEEVVNFDLTAFTEGRDTTLPEMNPGDALFVPEKTDTDEASWLKVPPERSIQVMGQVLRPDRYEFSSEMSLLDLLGHAGGPTSKADTANMRIVPREGSGREIVIFDLESYLRGVSTEPLPTIAAGDTISFPELPHDPNDAKAQWLRQASENSIYVMGAVNAPGRYAFNESMGFLDILTAVDGPAASADLHDVRVINRNGPFPVVAKLDLELYLRTGDETLLPEVKPGDTIYVPSVGREWIDKPADTVVRVLGAVGASGRYRYVENMTILDLLAEAGGPSDTAHIGKIVVINSGSSDLAARKFNLRRFMSSPNLDDLPVLRPGDTVYVPAGNERISQRVLAFLRDTASIAGLFALLTTTGN